MSGPPYDAPPPLASELESMDLHMLREWLDESFSDNEADADVSSSSDASSDSLLQLLQQQQQSAAAATAVLQQPPPAMYVTASAGGASHSHHSNSGNSNSNNNSAGTTGGAAAKRPRGSSEKRPRHAGQTTVAGTSRELAVLKDDDLLKKRSWPNQREELLYLRTKVCTLENELRELKIASRRQFSSASRITSADGVAGPNALVACVSPGSLWEQVANRQLDEKVRAEVENRKLRGMVEAQIRLAKRLQQLLRKRQVWDGLMDKKPKFASDLKPEESKIYAFLAQKIHDRYPHLDAYFAEQSLQDIAHELREVAMKFDEHGASAPGVSASPSPSSCSGAGGGDAADTSESESCSSSSGGHGEMFLEMKEVKLLPFDFRATDDAAWRCLKNEIITMHNTSATVVDNDENVLRAKVAVKIAGRGADVELTVWTIWHRFSEHNRVVYLVESLAITGGASSPGAAIIQVKQSAAAFIQPFEGSSAPEASIIKVYMRSTPSIIQDPNARTGGESPAPVERHPLVGMLTDVLIGSYHQNIEAMYKAVENLLLNDMLSGKRALSR